MIAVSFINVFAEYVKVQFCSTSPILIRRVALQIKIILYVALLRFGGFILVLIKQ